MTLQQLKYVKCVAKYKSMNKAADELFITQPSLSCNIKRLEEELGFAIFIRFNKGVEITEEGAGFLEYAGRVLEQYDLLEEKFIYKGEKQRCSICIQHDFMLARIFFNLVKETEADRYEYRVLEAEADKVIENVKLQKSELGILYFNKFNEKTFEKLCRENDLEFHDLFSCGIYAYVYRKHPLARMKILSCDELLKYPLIVYEQGDSSLSYMGDMIGVSECSKQIRVSDRAVMQDLIMELNGYTICAGIFDKEQAWIH